MSHKSEHAPGHAAKAAKPSALTFGIIALILVTLVVAVVMLQDNVQRNKRMQSQLFPSGTESTKVDMTWLEDQNAAASAANAATETEETVAEEPAPAPEKQTAEPSKTKSMGVVTHRVKIETVKGVIEAELYGKDAPNTVANFVKLINKKFYDGLTFHRVEPGFVIQGGDPNGNGSGGPGHTIKLEIAPKLKHIEGALAMARAKDPDSAGSQFYITLAETPHLDGKYAVFGKVTKGMNIAQSIAVGDKMTKVTIEKVK